MSTGSPSTLANHVFFPHPVKSQDYRWRMKILRGAENITKASLEKVQKSWKFLPGGQAFVKNYIKAKFPEDWADLQTGKIKLEDYEDFFHKDKEAAIELKEFAEVFNVSYAPLFNFRYSLFESLPIRDPHALLLNEPEEIDETGETVLDPIHLLRYYEFIEDDGLVEVVSRAKEIYQLSFRMRYYDDWQEFVNLELNKLTAFKNCTIERLLDGAVSPTPLLKVLEKNLLPGVIICPRTNANVIYQLHKQGIISYPIKIVCNDLEKEYKILVGLSGILTMAMKFKQLRLPDDEDFVV